MGLFRQTSLNEKKGHLGNVTDVTNQVKQSINATSIEECQHRYFSHHYEYQLLPCLYIIIYLRRATIFFLIYVQIPRITKSPLNYINHFINFQHNNGSMSLIKYIYMSLRSGVPLITRRALDYYLHQFRSRRISLFSTKHFISKPSSCLLKQFIKISRN